MNATRHLTPATLVAAALAAVVLLQAPVQAAEPVKVVQLPTVHVVASRSALAKAAVVVLPTVHVVAKRQPTLLAQKAVRANAL